MQKIRNALIDRLIAAHPTSNEINLFLFVSRFQDEAGRSVGVHYKEACKALSMSYQGYYDAKVGLERKKLIRCEKESRVDQDIIILDNEYTGEEYHREGYVTTNHNIFYQEDFMALRAGAKLLALDLLKIGLAGKRTYQIGTEAFFAKYKGLLGVSKRVLRSYLMALKRFFHIGIKDKKYYITPRRSVERQIGQKSEAAEYRDHNVDVLCRRNRIKEVDRAAKEDVCALFCNQYTDEAKKAGKKLFELVGRAVERSLEKLNENERKIIKRFLKPKLIHRY